MLFCNGCAVGKQDRWWQVALKTGSWMQTGHRGGKMGLREVVEELRELRADVQGLQQEMHRYKGFVGGVVWCFGGLTAAMGFVFGAIWGQ